MTPQEFWLTAASWGSFFTSGDPGACMYGFDERGCVQSEQHRQACINWIVDDCRPAADQNDDPDERETNFAQLDALLDYLKTAPIG